MVGYCLQEEGELALEEMIYMSLAQVIAQQRAGGFHTRLRHNATEQDGMEPKVTFGELCIYIAGYRSTYST